ncbi:hypothetical protein TRAPUB_1209 [Trametes pubescens]|uniref:C2H2-type domain-containing protein n=1 Tax=Trametes pubescens TaxID=154538 RepID=A0A1M2VK04_TRAPU|nr:hypothetical protein TRAPUB_1209 [Trametes pubescens]
MSNKRASQGGSKKSTKKPRTVFKPCPIADSSDTLASAAPNISSTSNAPAAIPAAPTTTQHTRGYQVYSLSDGRLGMRHKDSSMQVESTTSTSAADSVNSAQTEAIVAAVFEGLSVEEAEGLHPDHQQHNFTKADAKRPRPELRASARVRDWVPHQTQFLDELLRFFGSEYAIDTGDVRCHGCDKSKASLRCTECECRKLFCKSCIVNRHKDLALHHIKTWDGDHFKRVSLESLGLIIQLGHDNETCDKPAETTRQIVVGDISGIHEVTVRFCECLDDTGDVLPQWTQLFRKGWFPATTKRPETAFTFRMLDIFQELNFQAKTNVYDYWRSLERVTDNSGGSTAIDRYKQFSHCVRLWRHLVMLKRGGRAHDPEGIANTKEGELALECPACPHPGKNLPPDWETSPAHIKWLYTLFLMIDANFRAKLKDRGLDDYELAPGWSYYVENSKFKAHVDAAGEQTEKNGCSAEHKAILNANLRREGYIASGVGVVLCTRHALIRKNTAGDIPLGEKYAIMDYLIFSTVLGVILALLLSYDIVCQWYKNLPRRIKELPPRLYYDLTATEVRYAIPKKHIRVHGPAHSRFSFNYLKNVGRTYGEGIEAQWAYLNPVSLSAREMGPGVRHEVLNDHWGAWNWQKIIDFAPRLLASLRDADKTYAAQHADYMDFSLSFTAQQVSKWMRAIHEWDEDPVHAPDPYEEPRTAVTLKSTRLQIADEEAEEIAAGTLPLHDVSPGVFLQLGLDLEEQQRNLRSKQSWGSRTEASLASIQEKRNALARRVDSWQTLQDLHMPIVAQIRVNGPPTSQPHASDRASVPAGTSPSPAIVPEHSHASAAPAPKSTSPNHSRKAEEILLWLPSALPVNLRSTLLAGLADKERRLRLAQADDSLEEIRRYRRILTGILEFKQLNVTGTGQKAGTKVRTLYTSFQDKIVRAAARYRAARSALETLDAGGDWERRFKVLLAADIRGPGRDSESNKPGEGRYEISWIWLVPNSAGELRNMAAHPDPAADTEEYLQNIAVEWAQSKARAERWGEEVKLLQEEMRRVIEYFRWKVQWWRDQAHLRDAPDAVTRGLGIYAARQAAIFEGLARRCVEMWFPYLKSRDGGVPVWMAPYATPDLIARVDGARTSRRRPRRAATALDSDDDTADEFSASEEES